MSDEKRYVCHLINKADRRIRLTVGGQSVVLEGGSDLNVTAHDPKAEWAMFSEVEWRKDGKVSFKRNKSWENPWSDKLTIELLNLDGQPVEGVTIDGRCANCMRGIPKLFPIMNWFLAPQWIFYESAVYKAVEVKVKRTESDYFVKETQIKWIKKARPRKEIERIKQELNRRHDEFAKQTELKFKEPTEEEQEIEVLGDQA